MAPKTTARLSAQKLRSLLSARKITQEKLAEDICCSDRQVRNWVTRDTDAHISYIFAIADVCQTPVNDLVEFRPMPAEKG